MQKENSLKASDARIKLFVHSLNIKNGESMTRAWLAMKQSKMLNPQKQSK